MARSKLEDVAYVRFRAPDVARMAEFLKDFGMVQVRGGPADKLFMRGRGDAPVVHITEVGEPRFLALGLRASSLDDLRRIADADQAAVEASSEPGGGFIARLTDPDGHGIEVVAGQERAKPLEIDRPAGWNSVHARARIGALKRTGSGAATVVRFGHCVLNVSDFRRSEAWYKDRFGLVTSDEMILSEEVSVGAFLRCDRGAVPTDHHSIALVQSPKGPGFNHAAFEVSDMDDLMRGHQHLKAVGATSEWGVGRHYLGSQVFDYWRDPWGFMLEHWTDGDLMTSDAPAKKATMEEVLGVQWGPSMPPTFG